MNALSGFLYLKEVVILGLSIDDVTIFRGGWGNELMTKRDKKVVRWEKEGQNNHEKLSLMK